MEYAWAAENWKLDFGECVVEGEKTIAWDSGLDVRCAWRWMDTAGGADHQKCGNAAVRLTGLRRRGVIRIGRNPGEERETETVGMTADQAWSTVSSNWRRRPAPYLTVENGRPVLPPGNEAPSPTTEKTWRQESDNNLGRRVSKAMNEPAETKDDGIACDEAVSVCSWEAADRPVDEVCYVYGPPGNWVRPMLAKAIAKESGAVF
nr:hypothetical protein Iba_chr06cCG7380 [Ipomoea batatas]